MSRRYAFVSTGFSHPHKRKIRCLKTSFQHRWTEAYRRTDRYKNDLTAPSTPNSSLLLSKLGHKIAHFLINYQLEHNMEDHFQDPADAANFLSRYREARRASAPSSPAMSIPNPPNPPSPRRMSRTENARNVWGSVFHPLGKSPTSADRYDLSPGQTSAPGFSASEVHSKGTGISLDAKVDD